jgi:DNA-binding beta-propeller fold protein YncE
LLLGALAMACHQRRPMPALPVEPQPPPPEGVVVPPPGPPPPGVTAPAPMPATTYRILATAESQDQVALIHFKPCQPEAAPPACGAQVERTYSVGIDPSDIEGPHGVVASPDGRAFYVSMAHGRPFGRLEKYDIATGRRLGAVELGMFPATLDISPSGAFVYAINGNPEDPDMRPSALSIDESETMTEVARPETCRMPHGTRLNPQGTLLYSGCMMNDLLVEVDARSFAVRRLFDVTPGRERAVAPAAVTGMSSVCSPTWAQPSADGARVYVACNKSGEIVEVDVDSWSLVKRWKTPPAPYNLAVTPDGKLLVATQKGPGTITIWRLSDGALLAEIPGTRKAASGVATSRDSRFAFVTLEGIGGEPGTIDIIDLKTLRKVATVEIGGQAGGIGVLP